ncbi:nuclear transport factor 2 family protein [Nakamurella sp. A5-74]|uniref:Nuclear transport factor 2 family protein n=1 Tax=Nakamurella sp. A5-74 TaxID=3158264 RepID=A0AAU8DMA4_9ACTN
MTDQRSVTADTASTLQGYLDALVSGDLDRIGAFFAPDATWQIHGTMPLCGIYRGSEEIMTLLSGALGGLFEPGTQAFTFGAVVADGETAALEWNVTGTGSATHRRYDNDYCGIFVIRNKRIHAVREYFDTDHVREVLYGSTRSSTEVPA